MTLSDTLAIGDAASEASHGYSVEGATSSSLLSSTYEGENDTTTVTLSGRGHKGHSEFTMEISPSNQGVILRRSLDYATGNQAADVFVDGALVGRWYTAGRNGTHRWRDSDYAIGAKHTAGKSRITVKVQFVSSDTDWNEFRYEAHSLALQARERNCWQGGY